MDARRLLLPDLPCALWILTFCLCATAPYGSHLISADGDFAMHVTHGRAMLEQGGLLAVEPTTVFTAGKPFVAHEWLAQLALGAVFEAGGLLALSLGVAALIATIFALLLVLMRRASRESADWACVTLVVLALLVTRVHLLARPHLITWLLALVWTWRLDRFRKGELGVLRWIVGAAVMMLVWVNAHGGFLVGFYVLGLYGLGALATALRSRDAARGDASLRFVQLFTGGLILLAVSGLNPYGFELHAHIAEFLGTPELQFPNEFAPPELGSRSAPHLAWIVAAVVLLARGERAPLSWWMLTLGLAIASARSARHASLLVLLTAPFLAARLQAQLETAGSAFAEAVVASSERLRELQEGAGGWLTAALLALAVSAGAASSSLRPTFDPARLPVEAVAFVAEHPERLPGQGWNPYHWGGYVTLVLYPERLAFANSLSDHWTVEHARRFTVMRQASPGWEQLLADYGVRWALVEVGSPLDKALARRPDWECVHDDAIARVFRRKR